MKSVAVVAGAAVIANLFESYLGAALQGKALWMSNDIVNGIQICVAACIALVTTAYLYPHSSTCCAMISLVHLAATLGNTALPAVYMQWLAAINLYTSTIHMHR